MNFKQQYTLNEIFWVSAFDNETKQLILKPFVLSDNLEEIKFLDGSEKILFYNPKKNISKDVSMLLFFKTQFEHINIYTSQELLQETLKSNKKVSLQNNKIKLGKSRKYTLEDINEYCSNVPHSEKSLNLLSPLFRASAKNIMLEDAFSSSNIKEKFIKYILKRKNVRKVNNFIKEFSE